MKAGPRDRFGRSDLAQLEQIVARAGRTADAPQLASWSRFGPTDDVRQLRPSMLHFVASDVVAEHAL